MSVSLKECEAGTNAYDLIAALKHVGRKTNFEAGRYLHLKAIEAGCDTNKYVATALITMYGRCGSMLHARALFNRINNHDAALWNSLTLGYVQNGQSLVALDLFRAMEQEALLSTTTVTYVAVLKALGSLASEKQLEKKFCLERAVKLHRHVHKLGFHLDMFVANTLIDTYGKCGCMQLAEQVFLSINFPQAVSWTNLIMGYVENGDVLKAMDLFHGMDCPPNAVTFVSVIKGCIRLARRMDKRFCLWKGVGVHKQARQLGLDSHFTVANTLVDMYRNLGCMVHARTVFDEMISRTVVSWTTLVMGYVDNGESALALALFSAMDCKPNYVTFVAALKSCSGLISDKRLDREFCLEKGMEIHKQAKEQGYDAHLFVASALVDMYSKCGSMSLAREVFNRMPHRNVVSWNSLLKGYVENGQNALALELFTKMDCEPDSITFIAVLKACGSLGAVGVGRCIHARIWNLGLEQDQLVANCLLDFYGKCGIMDAAEQVFSRMRSRDVISWTALIAGYSLIGDTPRVFSLVKRMQESGVQPNGTTYLLVLTACSHTGFVEEGKVYFESMLRCGVKQTMEHFTCMVDMFGRANRLEEALAVIKAMPFEANSLLWRSLLGACRKWNNVKVGEEAFAALLGCSKEEDTAPGFVMMGNLYKM